MSNCTGGPYEDKLTYISEKKLVSLREEIRELKQALKEVRGVVRIAEFSDDGFCPVCKPSRGGIHNPGCAIEQLLARLSESCPTREEDKPCE